MAGCSKPHRAKGLCSTHYNQLVLDPDKRHVKVKTECSWCDKVIFKEVGREKRYGELFCSYPCRDSWARASGVMDANLGAAWAMQASLRWRAERKLARAAAGSRGNLWTAGACSYCGDRFVARQGKMPQRHCSINCGRYERGAQRLALEREPYLREDIFKRDDWRCHPHPRAPTIDHLIPLSDGGPDKPSNVATACFECNVRRGARGPAQLILF